MDRPADRVEIIHLRSSALGIGPPADMATTDQVGAHGLLVQSCSGQVRGWQTGLRASECSGVAISVAGSLLPRVQSRILCKVQAVGRTAVGKRDHW